MYFQRLINLFSHTYIFWLDYIFRKVYRVNWRNKFCHSVRKFKWRMYHQLTGFVKYIARSKLRPHCVTPNISILVCFCTNMFDLVNNFLQATHRRNSLVVETVSNNNNIIISKIVISTFSIATRSKYPKTLISEICTCMTSCWSFYKFLQNLREPSRFKKRSLNFMTWIYLTSFNKDVLFQCFFWCHV